MRSLHGSLLAFALTLTLAHAQTAPPAAATGDGRQDPAPRAEGATH